jgi:sister-chromatid-cohesion protein PDS5
MRLFFDYHGYFPSSQELVDSLYSGLNTPTILQSLGCIAQHSVSAFEAQNQEFRSYIFGRIFQVI